MAAVDPIRIDGLVEFRRGIAQVDKAQAKLINKTIKQAGEVVAAAARARVPRVTGRAQKSIRVQVTKDRAVVRGGVGAEYYAWLDFGGSTGRGHVPRKSNSGSVKRPRPARGRYIYPAYDANVDEITEFMVDELRVLFAQQGLEVDRGE